MSFVSTINHACYNYVAIPVFCRFMLRVGGRRNGVVALSSHMKEWLRPIQSKHGRTKLVTVIQSLDSCMRKHTGLDWQPLGHLLAAGKALEEAQRVAMYAQVFAFYLGCIPKLYNNQTPGPPRRFHDPLDMDGQSGFRKRLYSDNDPRALDAIMFYDCLEQLEVALHSLSKELLVTVEASLLIRLWMDDRQDSVRVSTLIMVVLHLHQNYFDTLTMISSKR